MRDDLEFLFGPGHLVFAGLPVTTDTAELFFGLATDIADGDFGVLSLGVRDLDQIAAAFLRKVRDDHPDDQSVIGGVHTEIGIPDRLLHRLELAGIVGLDHGHPGLGHRHAGQLDQGGGSTVVIHDDLGEHRRTGAAGTYRGEILLGHQYGLFHLLLRIEEGVVDHGCS